MPTQYCRARLFCWPASFTGQHGKEFAECLHRQYYLLRREACQDLSSDRLAIRAIYAFGVDEEVGVKSNPHALAFVDLVSTPRAHIGHRLSGQALQ